MVNIFICGISGKMGKMICSLAENNPNIKITGGLDIVDSGLYPTFKTAEAVNVPIDVIVDFSRPETLDSVIHLAMKYGAGAVLATTGYTPRQLNQINEMSVRTAVLKSGNMSLGINLISELVKRAAEMLPEFDVEIIEKHHNQKIDAPSGTALMLADAVNEGFEEKKDYVFGRQGGDCKRKKNEISFASVRGGTIVGEHEVLFCGEDEIVSISHTALSRKILANGALKAALFLSGKKRGLYSMKDLFAKADN